MKIRLVQSVPVRITTLSISLLAAVGCAVDDGELEAEEVESTSQEIYISQSFVTAAKPFVVATTAEYAMQPLLSVGDRIPETSNPHKEFQLVGIPDGMGMHKLPRGQKALYVNHELVQAAVSEPVIGEPLNRGAFVSKIVLARDGRVLSGERAYDTVWNESEYAGPAADTSNSTRGFARFCSGSLSWKDAGFDRPIFFAGEESGGAATFDGLGGLGIAIFDNELHTLPKFGRFPWEQTIAQPKPGNRTVLIGMEDGPPTPDSQLYLYVGEKDPSRRANGMRRNGLDNGKMYVLIGDDAALNNEVAVQSGSFTAHWAEIEAPETLTDVQLEAASDALGAFGFIRTEDGAFNPKNPNEYYFVTTGGGVGNLLGRMYKATFSDDVLGPVTIEMIYNGDTVAAAGGDIAFAPDNIDTDGTYVMVQEDGTTQSRIEYASRSRDGSVWRFDIAKGHAATRIAELNPPGRNGVAVLPGIWETSGIIATPAFGQDSWLMNVQGHSPSTAPAANTVEDGQIVLMRRTQFDALVSDE